MDQMVIHENKNRTKPEKTNFAQKLEAKEQMNFGEKTDQFSPEVKNMRQRLGNVVTQLEMNNAEARNQLREMLDFQVR